MNTIGKNYEHAFNDTMYPGNDAFYVPPADGGMDCGTLQSNSDKIDSLISYWYGVLQTGNNNNTERDNINKILNVLKSRKEYYATITIRNCTTAPKTPAPATPPPVTDYDQYTDGGSTDTTTTPTTGNNTGIILLAAGGLGLLLLSKKKGSRKKKVSGKKDDSTIIWIGLGAGILYFLSQRKTETAPVALPPSTTPAPVPVEDLPETSLPAPDPGELFVRPDGDVLQALPDGSYSGSILGNQVTVNKPDGSVYVFTSPDITLRNLFPLACIITVTNGKIDVHLVNTKFDAISDFPTTQTAY